MTAIRLDGLVVSAVGEDLVLGLNLIVVHSDLLFTSGLGFGPGGGLVRLFGELGKRFCHSTVRTATAVIVK